MSFSSAAAFALVLGLAPATTGKAGWTAYFETSQRIPLAALFPAPPPSSPAGL